jgi:DNA-binding HxlR family transcriptional regulator
VAIKKPVKKKATVRQNTKVEPAEHESPQVCAKFHHAVELIGRRWSGAIISSMIAQPRCFNEFLAAVPGLSDRLLTERLRELEKEGLVRRTVIAGPPVRVSYELTDSGKDLEPAIEALGKWAEKWVGDH